MSAPSSPALSRRELTARLRQLRSRANLTLEDVASLLFVSAAKVSRMETGARPVTLRDVSGLSTIYRLTDEERGHLFALVERTREPTWGEELELAFATEYNDLEAAAVQMHEYQAGFLPSLVQTEEYARALTTGMGLNVDAAVIEERVQMRVARQERLVAEGMPQYSGLIDEAALYRNIGGHRVMRAQLRHLLERAGSDAFSLRVVPFAAGAHPALDSPFVLLTFADDEALDVAYVEGLRGRRVVDQKSELDRFKEVAERIQRLALSQSATAVRVEEALEGWRRDDAR